MGRRRHPGKMISRLVARPTSPSVNPSPAPYGTPTHDSRSPWIATPSMQDVSCPSSAGYPALPSLPFQHRWRHFSQRVMRRLPRPYPRNRLENRFLRASSCRATTVWAILSPTVGTPESSFPPCDSVSPRLHRRREISARGHPVPRSCTGYPADLSRIAHGTRDPPRRHPISLTRLYASTQLLRYRKRLVLLTDCPLVSSQNIAWCWPVRANLMSRPLRSPPLQGDSPLHEPVRQRIPHQYSAPRDFRRRTLFPLAAPARRHKHCQEAPVSEPAFPRSMQKPAEQARITVGFHCGFSLGSGE